jgi:hypothetical protein
MKILAAAICALGLISCAHAQRPAEPPPREFVEWKDQHALAAQDLCLWEQGNPRMARRLLQWQADNPARAEMLLMQAATRPPGSGQAYIRERGWQSDVVLWDDPAVAAWLDWAQRHPDAARDLANSGTLQWAAQHRVC